MFINRTNFFNRLKLLEHHYRFLMMMKSYDEYVDPNQSINYLPTEVEE